MGKLEGRPTLCLACCSRKKKEDVGAVVGREVRKGGHYAMVTCATCTGHPNVKAGPADQGSFHDIDRPEARLAGI